MNVESASASPAVTGAIRQAARLTGADFKYLLATAQVESNLNPSAQVATSSARGLFQFIEQTWLATLKEQGPALGYAPYANAIARTPAGDYAIADPKMIDAVMNLRADPNASALMAGAFTKANAGKLAARLGRNATEGELYIAHFLGSTGASRLIGLADSRPQIPAAAVFPGAARANPSIFYDGRGAARSASDVYRLLVGRYQTARGIPVSAPIASGSKNEPRAEQAEFAPLQPALTSTFAAAARLSPASKADNGSVFHSLFRTGENQPVAPAISALWTSPPPAAAPAPAVAASSAAPAENVPGALDLFQDQAPDARALFRGRV
jgi:hypothetical protein